MRKLELRLITGVQLLSGIFSTGADILFIRGEFCDQFIGLSQSIPGYFRKIIQYIYCVNFNIHLRSWVMSPCAKQYSQISYDGAALISIVISLISSLIFHSSLPPLFSYFSAHPSPIYSLKTNLSSPTPFHSLTLVAPNLYSLFPRSPTNDGNHQNKTKYLKKRG